MLYSPAMSRRPSWWLDALKLYWPLNRLLVRASTRPVLRLLARPLVGRLMNGRNFRVSYVPVNVRIPEAQSLVLGSGIIERLIGESAHRVVVRRCSCRDSGDCRTYPHGESCLLLGRDTGSIDASIARHLTREEALAHARRMISLGLVPMTGRVRMDDFYYGVPNRGRMLTMCFCCPCCCQVLRSLKDLPPALRPAVSRLEGVEVRTEPARCRNALPGAAAPCAACLGACPSGALRLCDGIPAVDPALCIGCGRCTLSCPDGALRLEAARAEETVARMLAQVGELVDVR